MPLAFENADGRNGRVTDDLDVEYSGDWREDVERCVRQVEDETADESGRRWDRYTRLVIGLPEEAPIVEVERTPR